MEEATKNLFYFYTVCLKEGLLASKMNGAQWSASTRYKIRLRVILDWVKYEQGNLTLPPPELGNCKEWRFEIAEDQLSALFTATWERRMVPQGVSLEEISNSIDPYTFRS